MGERRWRWFGGGRAEGGGRVDKVEVLGGRGKEMMEVSGGGRGVNWIVVVWVFG